MYTDNLMTNAVASPIDYYELLNLNFSNLYLVFLLNTSKFSLFEKEHFISEEK